MLYFLFFVLLIRVFRFHSVPTTTSILLSNITNLLSVMLFLSPRTLKYFSELKNDSQVSLVRFGELHPVFVLNMSIKLSLTVLYNQIVLTKYCVIYTYESPSLSRIYWILCDMSIAFPSYKIVWNCRKYFLGFFHKFLLNIWYFESFTIAIMTWLTVTENLCHKWPRIYLT